MKPLIIQKTYGNEQWDTAIDYADPDNWLSLPHADKPIDVIYFHPTTYVQESPTDSRIAGIYNTTMRNGAKKSFMAQATVFEDHCNLFAPYYRQVSADYALTLTPEENNELIAYSASQDPAAALNYYFEHHNNGRPFFLAGHSQGAHILLMLLADYFKKHPHHYTKMIAAYIIGYSVTTDYLQKNPHLRFAQKADDIGVIISYNTEGRKNKNHHNSVVSPGAISINPLNWKLDETYADAKENLGSLDLTGTLVKGYADAQIDLARGVVICSTADSGRYAIPACASDIFGPESYHAHDYGFYYMNLKQNISTRISAWHSR